MKKPVLIFISVLSLLLYSCQDSANDYVDLSGNYWFRLRGKLGGLIESKSHIYYNKIYPGVVDYNYDKNFIVAEQKPEIEATIQQMGSDFKWRYEYYERYKQDSNALRDYDRLSKRFVLKDSALYSAFVQTGVSLAELNNLAIGIELATRFVKEDREGVFKNPVNYWIITLPADSVIGPLSKTEYLETKKLFGIENSLKLKFEE